MSIAIDINAEEVQKAVVEAVANSVVGERVKKAVEDALKTTYGYGSKGIIEQAVNEIVQAELTRIVREQYADHIKQQVASFITPDEIDRMTQAAWNKRAWS